MGDIVVFTQQRGQERFWVPRADEDYWIRKFGSWGQPAARWRDFVTWGGYFPPHPESVGDVMLYPHARKRRYRAPYRS